MAKVNNDVRQYVKFRQRESAFALLMDAIFGFLIGKSLMPGQNGGKNILRNEKEPCFLKNGRCFA